MAPKMDPSLESSELVFSPGMKEVPAALRRAGVLWMAAGALAGGLLVSLGIGLTVLAAVFRMPPPAPGLLVLGLLVGGGLFREGLRMARGEPDAPLSEAHPRALVRTLALIGVLIGSGAAAEALAPELSLLILPFHIGVAVLGPWGWFNFLRWRLGLPWSRRAGWWGVGLGSLLVPALALFFEGIAVLMLTLGLVFVRLIVEGPAFLEQWIPRSLPPEVPSEEFLRGWMGRLTADPWVWIGILIGAAVVVPAIEEAWKALPAALRIRERGEASGSLILYGAAGGAGFALAENLLNWGWGIPWAPTAIGRLGATALHVFNGGWMGWAWSRIRQGHLAAGVGAYFAAWLLHGLWNAGAVALGGLSLAPLPSGARVLLVLSALCSLGLTMGMAVGGLGWLLPALGGRSEERPAPGVAQQVEEERSPEEGGEDGEGDLLGREEGAGQEVR